MGGIYSGLTANDGYVLITNDLSGGKRDGSAIVRVNDHCALLIVTARGNFLIGVRDLLDKYILKLKGMGDGLSVELAEAIVRSFEEEFQKGPSFKQNPLPFLLLMVGYNQKDPSTLEHIFVRNRVVETIEKDNTREFVTAFDIKKATPAPNLFYGNSELVQYMFDQLSSDALGLEAVKLLSYFAMSETQKLDNSLFPAIRMAVISRGHGFRWITDEELKKLSKMARDVDAELSKSLLKASMATA